ncbi:hypothetical protein T484DRAFT_1809029 [Baffinella frigidus]|nr:hypothetical protein T484DRAFT_1809029 [Cryptophyta sp. CCMP2293]
MNVNVYAGVVRVACDEGEGVELLVLWPSAVRNDLALTVGNTVQIYPPWETLRLPTSERPVVMCSAKCNVLGHVDLSTTASLVIKDTLSSLIAAHGSYLPPTLVSHPPPDALEGVARTHIRSLPLATFGVAEEASAWGKVEKIATLDAWLSEASLHGTAQRGEPARHG